jgi:hypothetical protein
VGSATDPHGRILDFSRPEPLTFSSKQLFSCTHESEWTPLQTHYFSTNLIASGIEPGPLDLWPGTLTTRSQRRSFLSK